MMCRLPLKQYESMINYLNLVDNTKEQTKSFVSSILEENEPKLEKPSIDSLPPELTDEDGEEDDEEKQKKLFENKLISGLWGLHRFEKNPWSAKVRPFRRLKHFESLKLGALEKKGKLTKRMIGCCLSYLERSPYDMKYALCKCQLGEKGIIDISALRSYHYIQYLDLSHNRITTLEPLSEMPFLQYLNVSHNYIETPFDFKAPLYLTTVNYSNNRIVKIPNLSAVWSITSLDLSFNCIREIKGLDSLKYLSDLNLSHNRIMMLENLSNLNIIRLNLSHNRISVIEVEESCIGFSTLSQLTSVDFSFNKLTSLNFLQKNEDLEEISITNNLINDLLEIYYLRHMMYLNRLDISDNMLCENSHFMALCIRTLPKLRHLNGHTISPEDRLEAATKENVSKFFPAHASRMRLLLLEQLNRPKIGAYVCPYGESIPSLIVIVGPPASKKKLFACKFVEHSEFLKLGISHTTRPKKKCEIDGRDYYYTKYDHFIKMVRNADFLTITEFNGHLYGIAHSELEKAINRILVFYSDLETGLILKMAGLNPKLVLAMPQDEKNHIKWLKDSYFFDENNTTTLPEITIKTCPTVLKDTEKAQEELDKEPGLFLLDDDDRSFEIEELSSTLIDSKIFKQCRSSFGEAARDTEVYKNRQSAFSEKDIENFDPKIPKGQKEGSVLQSEHLSSSPRHEKQIMNWKNYSETLEEFKASRELITYEPEAENFPNKDKVPNVVELKVESGMEEAVWKNPDTVLQCNDTEASCKLAKLEPNDHLDSAEDKDSQSIPDEQRESAQSAEDGSLSGILKKDVQDCVSDPSETVGVHKKSNSWQTNDSSSDATSAGSNGTPPQADKPKVSKEDSLTRERSSSNKRVSFTYGQLSGDDEVSSYDPNFFDQSQREHIKSVSNTHILRSMQNRFFDNPLLSVLSASELIEEKDDEGAVKETANLAIQAKTAYMTLAERFDALKTDKLGPYLARVMLLRKELLQLHYENPGLFQAIIFTDGDPNKCIAILKEITKHLVETNSLSKRHDIEQDCQEYKDYVNRKFEELKIFDNRYTRLCEDIFLD